MTDVDVGKTIRDIRKKRGLSQQELANKLGVTWEMVSRYERGRSSALLKLLELSEALEVSPTIFFSEEQKPKLAEGTQAYLTERFIPVLSSIPHTRELLIEAVESENRGIKILTDDKTNTFAIDIQHVGIRVDTAEIRNKGLLICNFDTTQISDKTIVVSAKSGTLAVGLYQPGKLVLAKVLQWMIRF